MKKEWTNTEIKFLTTNSCKFNIRELSSKLHRSKGSLYQKLYRLGLSFPEDKKYSLDEYFFSNPSDSMFYILGFITADGNVTGNQLRFDLAQKDKCVLYFIKTSLKATSPIKKIYRRNNWYVQFAFSSSRIVSDLYRYNVFPSKTGKERLPVIPKQYFWSYMRGLFDGDGCVYTGQNTIRTKICSASKKFLEEIKYVAGFGSINKTSTIYSWNMSVNDSIKFRDFIYNNESFCLLRKKEKFYSNFYTPSKFFWTKQDDDYIIKNYQTIDTNMMAKFLGRTIHSIRARAEKLKVPKYLKVV